MGSQYVVVDILCLKTYDWGVNRGATRLLELFPDRGGQTVVARTVGTSPSVVSRWMRSERRPSAKQRARLEDLYGIGWRLWDQRAPTNDAAPPAQSGPGVEPAEDCA